MSRTCLPGDCQQDACERLDESGWDTCFVLAAPGVVLGRIEGRRGDASAPPPGRARTPWAKGPLSLGQRPDVVRPAAELSSPRSDQP